jgi:hypothetical protein
MREAVVDMAAMQSYSVRAVGYGGRWGRMELAAVTWRTRVSLARPASESHH